MPAWAQQPREERVRPVENVKIDYAQVIRVEPVYQTLRATRMEEQCDPPPEAQSREDEGRLAKMVESVKDVFRSKEPSPPAGDEAEDRRNCRMVQVEREFRRPIAYDVDYVYKGTKYRSRLAEDPGSRIRIRVSVMPHYPDQPPPP